MGWGSILGATVGNIGSTIASIHSADKAAKRQIAWERERATHAHQWEVEDLKAAGLNPILSAGGSGAVTGGISAPVPDFSALGEIGNTITARKAQKAQEKFQNKQEEQINENIKNLKIQNKILTKQAEQEESNTAVKKRENEMQLEYLNSNFGKGFHYTGKAVQDIGGAIVGGAIAGGVGLAGKAMTARQVSTQHLLRTPRPNLMYEPNGVIYFSPRKH